MNKKENNYAGKKAKRPENLKKLAKRSKSYERLIISNHQPFADIPSFEHFNQTLSVALSPVLTVLLN
ncbi:hypothetical protein RSJ42_17390 [Methanosarcina hadiensis]|uniref:hypothetical protein n=1 Tax=Methanosarcina hadiensis TaxID=3078083 RepID=UPI0039774A75